MQTRQSFCGRWIAVDVSTSFELDHFDHPQRGPQQYGHQQDQAQQQNLLRLNGRHVSKKTGNNTSKRSDV
jgi:hypothetical protein